MECSVLYTRRPDVLRRAFSLIPEYLQTSEDPRAVNLMDYGVPLGRRFRALKLWFILRSFGREGLANLIREHVRLAKELAKQIEADPRFELAAPVPFSVVCFRYKGTDDENRALQTAAISAHRSVSEFVLESALARAEETLPDRQRFGLSAEQWEAFQAALSAPPRRAPRLAKLLRKPSVFDRGDI